MEKIKISFKGEPKFYYSVSNSTGKQVTICNIMGVIKFPDLFIDQVIVATGKAVCDTSDVYDKTLGEKIALAKAENMAYEKAALMINESVAELEERMLEFQNKQVEFVEKAANAITHNEEYIEDLLTSE